MTAWAAVCAVVVGLLSLVVLTQLDGIDGYDRPLGEIVFAWSSPREWLVDFLIVVDHAFNTLALTVYTAIAAVALLVRKHQRAAIWTILVMASAAATTTVLKNSIERARPEWEDPVRLLDSYSFPSGHATGIA